MMCARFAKEHDFSLYLHLYRNWLIVYRSFIFVNKVHQDKNCYEFRAWTMLYENRKDCFWGCSLFDIASFLVITIPRLSRHYDVEVDLQQINRKPIIYHYAAKLVDRVSRKPIFLCSSNKKNMNMDLGNQKGHC